MAEAVLSCSICLDLLKDPVTIPCGHSYCLNCIKRFWDQDDNSGVYNCPQSRETFTSRPALNKNTMLSELAEELRKKRLQAARPAAGPGDVDCDICTGSKHKAVKSCLVCLASYCETHIQSHYESQALQKHKLVEATTNLREKICSHHNKLLEIYCHTDQKFICYLCVIDEHSGHKTVSVAAERSEKQKQLAETQRESQHKIQQKEKKVQELKQDMDSLKLSVQSAVDESDRIFTDLIDFIQRSCTEVKEHFRSLEKTKLILAEELLRNLEQDLSDQRRRRSELEQLSNADDHIHFLQTFQSLCTPVESSELPSVMINPKLSIEDLRKVVSEVKEELFCKLQVFKTYGVDCSLWPEPKTREDFMKYWCRLTLDPNTAHTQLHLSDGNRKVTVACQAQNYPAHPERFDFIQQILCRESLSGRCYWEVEVLSQNNSTIVVSYKSINRKMQSSWGKSNESQFGYNDQSWGLHCFHSTCTFIHNNRKIELPLESAPSRIGVYLDHSAGSLSFYSVSDTMTLLHKVKTTFTQPLYAGFKIHGYDNFIQICDLKHSNGTWGR